MAHWFFLALGDGVLAFEPKEALRERFPAAFEAAGRPTHMAVFTRHEMEGRLQCEVIAYFTPAASVLAQQMGALPCEQPTADELDLLTGDTGAVAHFFSDGH